MFLATAAPACEDDVWLSGLGLKVHAGTSTIAEARYVLIGEDHARRYRAYDSILETYASRPDTVFVEGLQRGRVVDRNEHSMTSSIGAQFRVEGWDDEELVQRLNGPAELLVSVGFWLRSMPSDAPERPRIVALVGQVSSRTIELARNRRNLLLATLRAHRPGTHRTFVLGSWRHFMENPELDAFLAGRRYVIVVPETPPVRTSLTVRNYYLDFLSAGTAPAPREIVRQLETALRSLR